MYGELRLPPEPVEKVNKKTGCFLKGHVPHNKGKKWSEWKDGRKQKKVKRIALQNLRPRPEIGGWNKKQCIGIDKNGRWSVFESSNDAGRKLGLDGSLIRRCCRKQKGHHQTGGIRFFWADDPQVNQYLK